MLVNRLEVKTFIRQHKLRVGRKVIPQLECCVQKILLESISRAKRNKRRTVLGRDV